MSTGPQAKTNGAAEAEVQQLSDTRDTLVQGNTLRGILLSAYGWWLVGFTVLREKK
ncbi:hypothetical protein WG915_06525 [Corynebacterium sp. H128]|uniref:hypothetical protein n=1 Tax=unclassified Corynebacterium TaxID=2624378 RepID=UPI0030A520AE